MEGPLGGPTAVRGAGGNHLHQRRISTMRRNSAPLSLFLRSFPHFSLVICPPSLGWGRQALA